MKPFSMFPRDLRGQIRCVLTDIDDTLTLHGRLPAAAYSAMERLRSSGIRVVPITGRPAGWCDHIARMWPVDGVVGENGAFYFRYDDSGRRMDRVYWKTEAQRRQDRARLDAVGQVVLDRVPGSRIASDQAFREADLAIDFCEDVPPLPPEAVERIAQCFTEAGAHAKISSIHVNGWFGDYDKLAMTRRFFSEIFHEDLSAVRDHVLFSGDSPNDAPMFAFFPHAVGVANIRNFSGRLAAEPAWVTEREGGLGFSEMVETLLS